LFNAALTTAAHAIISYPTVQELNADQAKPFAPVMQWYFHTANLLEAQWQFN